MYIVVWSVNLTSTSRLRSNLSSSQNFTKIRLRDINSHFNDTSFDPSFMELGHKHYLDNVVAKSTVKHGLNLGNRSGNETTIQFITILCLSIKVIDRKLIYLQQLHNVKCFHSQKSKTIVMFYFAIGVLSCQLSDCFQHKFYWLSKIKFNKKSTNF